MVDVVDGLIEIMKCNTVIRNLLNDKIYGSSLPDELIEEMPIKCISIKPAGGIEKNKSTSTNRDRFDLWCYGETEYEANQTSMAVRDCLENVGRKTIKNMLIHSIGVAGGYKDIDPDNDFPALIVTVLVTYDNREIGG